MLMKTYLPVRFSNQAQVVARPRNLTQYRKTFDPEVPPALQRCNVMGLLGRGYVPISGSNSPPLWRLDRWLRSFCRG